MDENIKTKLQNTANKLRQLWGDNEDSQIIEQGIALIVLPDEETPDQPATTKPTTRRKS